MTTESLFRGSYEDFLKNVSRQSIKNLDNLLRDLEHRANVIKFYQIVKKNLVDSRLYMVTSEYGTHMTDCPWSMDDCDGGPDTCDCVFALQSPKEFLAAKYGFGREEIIKEHLEQIEKLVQAKYRPIVNYRGNVQKKADDE